MEVLGDKTSRMTKLEVLQVLDGIAAVIRERVQGDPAFAASLIDAVRISLRPSAASVSRAVEVRRSVDRFDVLALSRWADDGGRPGPED